MSRLITVACLMALTLATAGCGSLIVTQRSVESLAGQRGFTWETHAADGFVIYVEPGTDAAGDVDEITARAIAGRERVLAYLGEPPYEPTVSIFVVDTRDRMKDLIGRRSNATAYHASGAVCLVWSDAWRVDPTHELVHVVAMNRWGVPERWINEGLAVDATGPWRGDDVDGVCLVLRERGQLPSLSDVTRRYDKLPALVSYPAAGSFVRYVREAHGLETVRAVWDGGRTTLPTATGMDLDALEAAWLAVVDEADTTGIEYDLE